MLTLKNLLIPRCKNEHFVQKFTWTLLKKNLANLAPRQIFIDLPACCFIICVRTSFSWRGAPDSIQCYVGGCANFHLGNDVRACNIGRGTGVRGDKRQWYSFMCLCQNMAALKSQVIFQNHQDGRWNFKKILRKCRFFQLSPCKIDHSQTTTARNIGRGPGARRQKI